MSFSLWPITSQGVTVVLTARNEKRGMEALLKLQELGLSSIVFHQLDVLDPVSIKSLANFIQEKCGRLDILVRMKFFSFFFFLIWALAALLASRNSPFFL